MEIRTHTLTFNCKIYLFASNHSPLKDIINKQVLFSLVAHALYFPHHPQSLWAKN